MLRGSWKWRRLVIKVTWKLSCTRSLWKNGEIIAVLSLQSEEIGLTFLSSHLPYVHFLPNIRKCRMRTGKWTVTQSLTDTRICIRICIHMWDCHPSESVNQICYLIWRKRLPWRNTRSLIQTCHDYAVTQQSLYGMKIEKK